MREFRGLGASPGIIAAAAVKIIHSAASSAEENIVGLSEIEIFREALRSLGKEADDSIVSSSPDEIPVIKAYGNMFRDPDFISRAEDLISGGMGATEAIAEVAESFGESEEIAEVCSVIISKIRGREWHAELTGKSIIVADKLTLPEMLSLRKEMVAGICLDGGTLTSHVTVLSRMRGIPLVINLGNFSSFVENGDMIAVDGNSGLVVHSPSMIAVSNFLSEAEEGKKRDEELKSRLSASSDGVRVALLANVECVEEVERASKAGSEGVGLFRTEFLELSGYGNDDVYMNAALKIAPRETVFRVYDMGGEKTGSSKRVLGLRGMRYAKTEEELYLRQMVSILRASAYSTGVGIMFPMIGGKEEIDSAVELLEKARKRCREEGIAFNERMKVGAMIETPSAALTADLIADYVDFLSIGTNDLIQYTLVADRGDERVSYLFRPLHPAVLRLIKYIADTAINKGVDLSVCGEMAGSLDCLPVLLGMGIRKLSMAVPLMNAVKKRVSELSVSDCGTLVDRLLSLSDVREIEKEMREFNEG